MEDRALRKHISLACLIVLLVGLALCPTAASDRYTLITLVHTNDLHGRILTQSSGLARMATKIREIRAEMPNVVLLDAGDIFLCTYIDYYAGGRATVAAMNALGYDAAVVGNHELDLGEECFDKLVASAKFPFLSANLRSTAGGPLPNLKPYVILTRDGVNIGVLGLTTSDAIGWHWPASIPGIAEDDPIAVAKDLVPKLRKQVDVLIVLSHLGIEVDKTLAKEVPGIDFIAGGHSHSPISNWLWVGDTLITQGVAYGEAFSRIDFIVRKGESGSKVVSVNGKRGAFGKNPPLGKHFPDAPLVSVDASVPRDIAVREAYRPFESAANKKFAKVIGTAKEQIPGKADGASESALGDLAADAFRGYAKTDVAIVDMSQLTTMSWPAGPIHPSAVFGLDLGGYTEHYVVSAKIKGSDLLSVISADLAEHKAVGYYYSGLTLTCKLRGGVPVIDEVRVGGAKVEPDRTYSICAFSSRMTSIGNSVPIEVIPGDLRTARDVIVDYIRTQHTLTAPAQGRVRIE